MLEWVVVFIKHISWFHQTDVYSSLKRYLYPQTLSPSEKRHRYLLNALILIFFLPGIRKNWFWFFEAKSTSNEKWTKIYQLKKKICQRNSVPQHVKIFESTFNFFLEGWRYLAFKEHGMIISETYLTIQQSDQLYLTFISFHTVFTVAQNRFSSKKHEKRWTD